MSRALAMWNTELKNGIGRAKSKRKEMSYIWFGKKKVCENNWED
jgi:hypothetical protein